jgi:hypothetical protein
MTTDAGSTMEPPHDDSPRTDRTWVVGGPIHRGSEDSPLDEAPRDQEIVDGFWMDPHAMTHWLTDTGWIMAP